MASQVYEILNKAWKTTSASIFHEDLGDLAEHSGWLGEGFQARQKRSVVSGQPVFHVPDFGETAKVVSLEESQKLKFQPLSINEIKDMDSIVEALRERIFYTGNIVLGNSRFVEGSTNIHDSNFILNSAYIYKGKYLAFTSNFLLSEYVFGCDWGGESNGIIRCFHAFRGRRCFEGWNLHNVSDSFYCNDLRNSSDCLFSFNLWNRRHVIGNLELEPGKYGALKEKLVEEVVAEIQKRKKAPSLMDLIRPRARQPELKERIPSDFDMGRIDEAFGKTSEIILGKDFGKVEEYKGWLTAKIPMILAKKSAVSDKIYHIVAHPPYSKYADKRCISFEDSVDFDLKLDEKDLAKLSLGSAPEVLDRIALPCPEEVVGVWKNAFGCFSYGWSSSDVYKCTFAFESKSNAYCYRPRNSEHCFGCMQNMVSNFCIRSHCSTELSRCLEVDSSTSCSGLYFGHNCENVHDSFFCFNVKNIRNAVGNTPLAPEKFKSVKNSLLAQMCEELERDKKLRWDIYSIGCK
ncbi:MAG: hypothetical protein ACP5NX_00385 [Candidatus Bilamarchaeaceae archaeon]